MNEILQLNNNNNNSNNNIINNNNNDNTGFTVYILYQKEVQNTDHGLLQSMMDWIYMSNDSPYKYVSRNKSVLSINNYDITLHKDSNIKSAKPPPPNNDQTESSLWTSINFNLKYLKEIYVDKRHKDTCVLVSKVSSSTKPTNNVWKKSNPSNYQPFKSLYSNLNTSGANNNSKRSYLLTVLKFKDGPSKLLQSIQMLDRVLTNFDTKQEANNNTTTTNNNNNNQKSNGTTSVHTKSNNKTTSTKQQTSDGEQPVSAAPKTSHKSSTSTTPATNSQSVAKKSIENASTATLNQQQLQLQLQLQMQQQIQQQLQQQQQNFQPQAQLLHLKQLQQFQYDQQQQSKQEIIQSRKSVNLSEIGKSISSNKQPNSSSTHHTHGGSVIASDGNTNMNRLSLNSNIFYAPSSLTQHSSNLVSNNSNHQSLQNILPSLANANNSSNKSINNMSILNKNKAPTSSSNSLAINNNNNNNNNENNNESTNTTTTNNKNNFNFQLISQMLNSIHNNMNSINNSNSSSNIQQQANNQTKSIRNSSYLNSSQFNIQQQQQQLQQKLLMQQQQLQQQQQQQKQHHRRYSQYYPVKRSSSRLSSRYSSNYSQKDENVLSSDNFSEIGYQQYQNKKLNNSSVASVSTATNTNARNLATSAAAGANKSQTAIKSTTSLQNTDFETLPRRHSSFVTPNQVILQQQQQQQQQQHNRTSIYDHLDEKDSNLLKNTIQNFRLLKMAQANSSLDNLTAFPSNVNTEIDKEMRLLPIQSKSKSKSSNHSSSSSHHNHNHNHHNHRSKIVSSHDSFDNHEAAEHNYHQIERPKSAAAIIKSSLSQVTKKPPILSNSKKLSTKRASGTASSAASFHHNHNHHNHNHHNHHHSSSNSLKAVSCDLTNKLIENIVGINLDVLKSEVEAIKLNKVAANSDNKQQQPLTTQLVSKSVKSKLKQNDLTTLAVHSDSETANANDILLGSDHHRSSYYNLNSKLPPQQQQTNNPDFILSNKLNNSLKRNTIKINDPAREPIRLKEIINSFNSYENNFSNNLLSTTNDSITTSSNTATPTNMTLTNSISNPTTTTTTTTLANITAAIAAANNNLLNTSDLNQSCDSTNCGLNNNNNNNGYCNDFCPINNSSDDKSNQNGYSSYYSDYYNNGNNGGNNNNNNGEMIQAPKVSKTVIDNSELTKTNSRKSITSSASSVNCIMQQTCFNNNNNDENNKQIEMNENNNNNTYNTTKQQPVIIDCFENSCKNNFYNENTLLSILEANSINTGSLKDDVAMLTNKIRYYDNEKLSKYYNSFYEPTYITDLINNNNNNNSNSNNNNNNNCNGNCNTPTNETNDFCLTSPSAFTMDTYSNNDYQNAQNNPENMYLQQQQHHHHHQQQQTDNTNHQLIVNNTAVEQQQQQQPMPPPTKNRSVNMSSRNKRTFANMVWPMDPEEEKILRSNSPFIVPEIIVQRNEAVKSILKKNINSSFNNYSVMNINNNNSNNSILSSSPSPRASTEINLNNLIIGGSNTYGKKRVDFHENFLFVNVFDKNADEELNSVN
jgi:hypothetical protein